LPKPVSSIRRLILNALAGHTIRSFETFHPEILARNGLAEQARGTAVTSNSIVVGMTMTEHVEKEIEANARKQGVSSVEIQRQAAAHHRPTQLLERLATAEEVANMVVYVASPQASATTGAALRVEGGGISSIL